MMSKHALGAGLLTLALVVITGCHTLQPVYPMTVSEIQPDRYERVILDQLYILSDTSSSMQRPDRFPEKKAYLQSFVHAMPGGSYEVAAGNFGGHDGKDWKTLPVHLFNRAALGHFADHLELIGGTTDMHLWLRSWESDLAVSGGRAAVLILSDGRAPLVDTMLAVNELAKIHPGQLCIFAVQFGDDPEGAWLLRELTRIAGCGQVWNYEDVNSHEGLERVIRRIFFQRLGLPDIDGELYTWVLDGVLFDFDRSEIRPEFNPLLDEVASVLRVNPAVRVRIDGHTCSIGSVAYNQGLSERRAASVRQALIDRGIPSHRMESVGYGQLRPVRPNDNAVNRAQNRRVEIKPIP
jgi:OOP family OmpA-OmpF porin